MRRIIVSILVRAVSKINSSIKRNKPYTADLVILFDYGLGDFMLYAGCIAEYKKKNKKSKISLICGPQIVEMAIVTGLFTDIYSADKNISNLYRIMKSVKGRNFVMFPTYAEIQDKDEYIASLVCADNKIACWDQKSGPNSFFNRNYTRVVSLDYIGNHLERCSELFTILYGEKYDATVLNLKNRIIPSKNSNQYFVVNLGASIGNKCWPVHCFTSVIEYIANETGLIPFLIGDKAGNTLAERFSQLYSGKHENYCGKTSIVELIQLIGNAAFYLGNDTGTTHIAASCGIPNFALTSEAYDVGCMPYPLKYNGDMKGRPVVIKTKKEKNCRNCTTNNSKQTFSCRQSVQNTGVWECINEISVNEVINAIERSSILDKYRKKIDNRK